MLYDVTSTYFEGRTCPLARLGYNRDGKRHKLQIVFGLLCSADGCPVAVEVFEGNVGDPSTLASQIAKLKERFGLDRVVLVGDRGMITEARLEQTSSRPASTGSPPCGRRRSAAWPRRAPFSFRCSTSAISPRSPHPIIRVSAWWSAAIRCSPTSAPASGETLLDATEKNLLPFRPASGAPKSRCAARTRSRSRSVP